jgi:hypothetical protein
MPYLPVTNPLDPPAGAPRPSLIIKINHQFDQELSVAVRQLPWQWRRALVISGVELNQGGGGIRI